MSAYGEMAAQTALNIGSSLVGNELARQREAEARAENYKYGEMAANKADQRARRMYADLQSPEALLKQYKEAGLSPSLMFANGGSQGATPTQGAQSSGGSGISPTTFGIDATNLAQMELMSAEARKTNAEADTIEGKNDRGKAELSVLFEQAAKICAETDNLEADTAYKTLANEIQSIEKRFKEETFWTDVTIANETANKIVAEVNKINTEQAIDAVELEKNKATYDTQIKIVEQQLKKLIAETNATEAEKRQFEAFATKALFDMQLDYWYSLLDKEKFDFEKWMQKWHRKLENWYKNAEVKQWNEQNKQEAARQSIDMWQTKWNVLGSILTAGVSAAGRVAAKPIVTSESYDYKGADGSHSRGRTYKRR